MQQSYKSESSALDEMQNANSDGGRLFQTSAPQTHVVRNR